MAKPTEDENTVMNAAALPNMSVGGFLLAANSDPELCSKTFYDICALLVRRDEERTQLLEEVTQLRQENKLLNDEVNRLDEYQWNY